jgi:hypothetical protein
MRLAAMPTNTREISTKALKMPPITTFKGPNPFTWN